MLVILLTITITATITIVKVQIIILLQHMQLMCKTVLPLAHRLSNLSRLAFAAGTVEEATVKLAVAAARTQMVKALYAPNVTPPTGIKPDTTMTGSSSEIRGNLIIISHSNNNSNSRKRIIKTTKIINISNRIIAIIAILITIVITHLLRVLLFLLSPGNLKLRPCTMQLISTIINSRYHST
jgi:hypothetical protein